MSTLRLLAVTLTLLATAACNPFNRGQAVEVTTADAMLNSRWHGNLASPASLAGAVQMSGSATMAPNADHRRTIVDLELANAAPGGLHPWELHRGQCGSSGDYGLVGPSDAYKALDVDSDGRATSEATIDMQTPTSGDYFAVVYASQANSRTVVACGNLAPPTR
jgi:hypothetical protein